MQRSQDSQSVRVLCCGSSEFKNSHAYDGLVLDPALTFKTLDGIREQVLDDLELDADRFAVQLHPPNNCELAILPRDLRPGSSYGHLDETGKPIIFAHIKPKGKTTSSSLSYDSGDSQTSPGIVAREPAQQQSSLKQDKLTIAGNRGSYKAENSSAEWSVGHFEYIRIGIQECETKADKTAILREIVLVAETPKEAHRKENAITFLKVDAWHVRGVQIGHCEDGDEFDFTNMTAFDHLDPAFASSQDKKDIITLLYDIVDEKVDFQFVRSLSSNGKKKATKNREPFELVRAPAIPQYANEDDEPFILQKHRRASNIPVVVYFKNEINDDNLSLPINLQAMLGHSETYADLEKWIFDGDDGFAGLKENPVLSKINHGFRLMTWVLPHVQNSVKMYCWTKLSDWKVCDWLDDAVVKQFGKALYIEVHIHPARDERGIGPLELREMITAADVLNKAVSRVDTDVESDSESVYEPNKGKRPSKRRVVTDLEDGLENSGSMGANRDMKRRRANGREA